MDTSNLRDSRCVCGEVSIGEGFMQYDIFISYRRDGGDMVAHVLYERLTKRGYSVFQDIEVLRSGKFNTEIYEKIEKCKDVILILPPNALDRCWEEEDWIRKEIICAIENKKNIIPIMLRGFSWPSHMPKEISDIQFYNGLVANTEYFESFLEKLIAFLTSQPSIKQNSNFKQKHTIRIVILGSICVLTLLLPIIIIFLLKQPFGLLWRIIYFMLLLIIAKIVLYKIETDPKIAAACFSTLTEEDLKEIPDIVVGRVMGVFGKDIFLSKKEIKPFTYLYQLKRLTLGTWDNRRTNYLKIIFRRKLEWYDPSVFYLHSLSKDGEAVKMLMRQGFILQSLPNFICEKADYLIKNDFHIFLFYRKRRLDYAVIYQCKDSELLEKYEMIEEMEKHEEILK